MTFSHSPRLRALPVFAAVAAFGLTACSSGGSDGGDPGDDTVTEEAALGRAGVCDKTNLGAADCSFLAFGIQWNAPPGPRQAMIERGVRWVQLGVPYSKYHATEGYRQDCSGSVSMEWELPSNPSTAYFAPFHGSYSHPLASIDDLEPGDALNRVKPIGHIVLFAQWEDASHQAMFVLEEAAPGRLMQIRSMTRADAQSRYAPIRKNGL
jgi:hypothetical protein